MPKNIIFRELDTIEYSEAFNIQENLFKQNIENKNNNKLTTNYLLFCEHPHVYTLGKSGDQNNLLVNNDFLKKINATYYKTNRGGDITYHGFGQLVIYPIFDLNNFSILIKKYIYNIEEVIIKTLKHYKIDGQRIEKASGIWLTDRKIHRKICALGVRVSRGITMHGLAFNLNTDLSYFKHINPCGLQDKGVTSLQKEMKYKIQIEQIKIYLIKYFNEIFSQV